MKLKLSSPPLGFPAFLALALSFPSVILANASVSANVNAASATAAASDASTLGSRIYHLTEDIVGAGFYSHFEWENVTDPSHGRVTYRTQQTSIAQNLAYATSSDSFVLRADATSVLDPNGPGRASFRVRLRRVYRGHVAVFDIKHMPQGCGTWPGIRETKASDKPKGRLIDILEGINDEPPDLITLHTVANCTMPPNRTQTGTNAQLDCNVDANANAGCGRNYGVGFNANGGGGWMNGWAGRGVRMLRWQLRIQPASRCRYAIESTNSHISIWFWARDDRSVPLEGVPVAYLPNTSCDFETHFEEHNIIINLTLCGDWAGSAYPPTCPSTCIDHVNNDPAAFEEAYFDFASIRVYEPLA